MLTAYSVLGDKEKLLDIYILMILFIGIIQLCK